MGSHELVVPLAAPSPLVLPKPAKPRLRSRHQWSPPSTSPPRPRRSSGPAAVGARLNSPSASGLLSDELKAAFEDRHTSNILARLRHRHTLSAGEIPGEPSSAAEMRRGSNMLDVHHYCRRQMESNSQIHLDYYQPEARHYAWCKYAQQSRDWRMHLQLFLEDWRSSFGSTIFTVFVSVAILAQVVLMMVWTGSFGLQEVNLDQCALWIISWVLTGFFTMELVLRTISKRSFGEMCFSFFWWVDVASVVPDHVALIIALIAGESINVCAQDVELGGGTLDVIGEFLRIFRVMRILKIARLNPDTTVILRAITLSLRALAVPLVFVLIGAFFFGTVIYYVEQIELVVWANLNHTDALDEFPTPFTDIGVSVWFMLVTFTTIGYGDVSPNGHLGKVITTLAMLCGIILLAMPLAIVGNNFSMAWEERTKMRFVLQVQRKCIDRNISLAGIQKLFEDADTHNSGYLDYLEFRTFCEGLGMEHAPSEARRLFHLADEGRSGGITFFEFCHFIFPELDVEWLYERGIVTIGECTPERPLRRQSIKRRSMSKSSGDDGTPKMRWTGVNVHKQPKQMSQARFNQIQKQTSRTDLARFLASQAQLNHGYNNGGIHAAPPAVVTMGTRPEFSRTGRLPQRPIPRSLSSQTPAGKRVSNSPLGMRHALSHPVSPCTRPSLYHLSPRPMGLLDKKASWSKRLTAGCVALSPSLHSSEAAMPPIDKLHLPSGVLSVEGVPENVDVSVVQELSPKAERSSLAEASPSRHQRHSERSTTPSVISSPENSPTRPPKRKSSNLRRTRRYEAAAQSKLAAQLAATQADIMRMMARMQEQQAKLATSVERIEHVIGMHNSADSTLRSEGPVQSESSEDDFTTFGL